MPRAKKKLPAYCLHKASGRAVVRVNGKDRYLGPYGSDSSHEEYQRVLTEWRQTQSESMHPKEAANLAKSGSSTVNEILLRYLRFAKSYYVDESGRATHEYELMCYAIRPLKEIYGRTLVREFGPLALKALQRHLAEQQGLCRQEVNKRVNRIRRIFKWAVSEELAQPSLLHALQSVSPLRYGRTTAREAQPIQPVPRDHALAVAEECSPPVAAMIKLQLLTGARPGEIVTLRPIDIDQSGEIWLYKPVHHKNLWREQSREIYMGKSAQAELDPFLNRHPKCFAFSPIEAEEWRNSQRRLRRKSPMTPSQQARSRRKKPQRPKRERYDVATYRRAIKYAISRANKKRQEKGLTLMKNWSPSQLRHTRATEIRQLYGLEGSQAVLGHRRADVTQIYAARDRKLAERIARDVG